MFQNSTNKELSDPKFTENCPRVLAGLRRIYLYSLSTPVFPSSNDCLSFVRFFNSKSLLRKTYKVAVRLQRESSGGFMFVVVTKKMLQGIILLFFSQDGKEGAVFCLQNLQV